MRVSKPRSVRIPISGCGSTAAGRRGRPERSQFINGMAMIKRVCVFCGSSPGARPAYATAAAALAQSLVARGLTIVYGGGNVGLMGVLADTARAAGGKVIGVIPHSLVAKEVAHTELP